MSDTQQTASAFKDFVPFATSLFGAFFGALGAYWVGRFKEKRDEVKRHHFALLATQYALFSQWHIVENLRRFLEPHRSHEHRHMRLGKYVHADAEMVSFEELTFIIDTKDANMLQEIHLAQMSYLQTIKILDKYSAAQEEFEKRHPPVNLDPATKMAKVEVSKDEYNRMKIIVDLLFKTADEAVPKFDEQVRNIHSFVKRHFKNKKAIPGIEQLEPCSLVK